VPHRPTQAFADAVNLKAKLKAVGWQSIEQKVETRDMKVGLPGSSVCICVILSAGMARWWRPGSARWW
jgi:hypothetical protein